MKTYTRLFDIIEYQQENNPQEVCLSTKVDNEWKTLSTNEVVSLSNQLARALIHKGIEMGDKVGIISSVNRHEWNIMDLALLKIGAINVPMYPTISPGEFEYIMNDASVKMVFVSDADLMKKIEVIKDNVPTLDGIYTFDHIEDGEHWETLLPLAEEVGIEEVQSRKDKIKTEDLATLIYTSGTTGKPKGVMLSHQNICENTRASLKELPLKPGQTVLSCLPLCHIFERMVIYSFMAAGCQIYYAPIYDQDGNSVLGDYIREIKPEFFTTVPRILEKVYEKIINKGLDLKGIKRALFFWALNLGLQYDWKKDMGGWYNFKLGIANKLIFSKWREALGGRIVAIASGSAPLQERLARVFSAANINIREGYGLTETSPVLTFNRFNNVGAKIGTVGLPLENVQLKIADDGEILAKGPNVMMGYYNQPEKTAEVFTEDGWFMTGDIGEFDDEGYLKITDRKKQLMKTSGGKYVAPTPIEEKFKESMLIEQMIVVAEAKKFVSALIVPSFLNLTDWAEHKGIQFSSTNELIQKPEVIAKFQEIVDEMNEHFSHVEQVKKFKLLKREFTIEDGELTPTMKLKRKQIIAGYQDEINEIYG